MSAITLPLSEISEYEAIKKDIKKRAGIVEVNGCSDSQKLHLAYGLSENYPNTIIVTWNEQRANDILSDYSYYNKEIKYYPARDLIFYQADIHGNLLPAKRLEALAPLFEGSGAVIVTTFDALMEELAPFEALLSHILSLSAGDTVDLSDLERELTTLGYGRNYQVEDKGQFSIHGGIIDIFPLTEVNPVRIELWGDEIDSIRSFDVLTQRSLEKLDSFTIYP
ncbi:MAG: transcription-repair coupling factor, partial [Lachnospiraceae bacterium]|nr:transcription-repair coupling factor [Lachnospiraceae bacterium]